MYKKGVSSVKPHLFHIVAKEIVSQITGGVVQNVRNPKISMCVIGVITTYGNDHETHKIFNCKQNP